MKRLHSLQSILLPAMVLLLFGACQWGASVDDMATNVHQWSSELNQNALDAPQSVDASGGTHADKVGLSWGKVDGADYYIVYRSDDQDSGFAEVLNLRDEEIVPIAVTEGGGSGGTGTPTVIAPVFTSDVNLVSIWGEGIHIPILQNAYIKITIDAVTKTVQFPGQWFDRYDQADVVSAINAAFGRTVCFPHNADGKKYVRITTDRISDIGPIILENEKNPWTKSAIATLLKSGVVNKDKVQFNPTVVDGGGGGSGGTTQTYYYYYVDSNVAAGTHYYYRVKAFSDEGAQSESSDTCEGFAIVAGALAAPVNVQVQGAASKVTITWSAVSGANYYQVLRAAGTGASYSILSGSGITDTTFEDVSVPPGKMYYKVVGYNGNGEGKHSSPVSGHRTVLSDMEFYNEFMKATKVSQNKIPSMGGFGEHTIKNGNPIGGTVSGTCEYYSGWITFMSRVGVDITYTNYSDDYMTFDGTIHTDITNITAQSGTTQGKISVGGIYKGYVDHYLTIDGGAAKGGYYSVYQDVNGVASKISWDGKQM